MKETSLIFKKIKKIGKIQINGNDFPDKKIYISLMKEKSDGFQLKACFYNKSKEFIYSKYLQDI